jgi:hypothetical protein
VHTVEDFQKPGGVYQVTLETGVKDVWSSKMERVFVDLLAQSWRVYNVVCSESSYEGSGPKYISTEEKKIDEGEEERAKEVGSAVHAAKIALEERGEKLQELGENSARLADGSSAFLKAAQGLSKKKAWWQF